MNKRLLCIPLLFCFTELSAQPVEYEFKNSEDESAFQELQETKFYAQHKQEIDEFEENTILWRRVDKDIMILVEDSGSGLFCFIIKFYVWDGGLWHDALELYYTTGTHQYGPDKIVKDNKVITIYSKEGDILISTALPDILFAKDKS